MTYRTHDNLLNELRQYPEFCREECIQQPLYDIVLAVMSRCHELGMTQKELAEKANISQKIVSYVESAEHNVKISTLANIAEALNTHLIIKLESQ